MSYLQNGCYLNVHSTVYPLKNANEIWPSNHFDRKKCKTAGKWKQTNIIFLTCKKSYIMYTSCIIILYYQWKLFFGDLKDISSIHHIIMCFFNQKQYMINDIVLWPNLYRLFSGTKGATAFILRFSTRIDTTLGSGSGFYSVTIRALVMSDIARHARAL